MLYKRVKQKLKAATPAHHLTQSYGPAHITDYRRTSKGCATHQRQAVVIVVVVVVAIVVVI